MRLADLIHAEESKRAAARTPARRWQDLQDGLSWAARQPNAPKLDPAGRKAEERRKLRERAARANQAPPAEPREESLRLRQELRRGLPVSPLRLPRRRPFDFSAASP